MSWRVDEEVNMLGQVTDVKVLRDEDDEPCQHWWVILWGDG